MIFREGQGREIVCTAQCQFCKELLLKIYMNRPQTLFPGSSRLEVTHIWEKGLTRSPLGYSVS